MLINADFKQIELCVLAQLSKDDNFIQLLNNNVDIYKYFAAIMYNKPEECITKEERDSLKVPILGISYGKGYKLLSQETKKSEEWCRDFIDNFYSQFPKVRELHDRWIRTVKQTGILQTFTGIRFRFKLYEKKYSEEYSCWFKEGYNPNEIKNYPVQNSAFILMSLFLHAFWRQKTLLKRDKYLLINTVHDSIMLDCRPEYIDEATKDLNEILDELPDICYTYFNERLLVPIKLDITTAESWYDL